MIEIIQRGIENNSSKKSIADTPGKDKSTIGKENKKHHTLPYKSKYPVEYVDVENALTCIRTTVLRTVLPSSHLSIKTCPLSRRMQRLRKIQSLPVRQVQV